MCGFIFGLLGQVILKNNLFFILIGMVIDSDSMYAVYELCFTRFKKQFYQTHEEDFTIISC